MARLGFREVEATLNPLDARVQAIHAHFNPREIPTKACSLFLERTKPGLHVLNVILHIRQTPIDATKQF